MSLSAIGLGSDEEKKYGLLDSVYWNSIGTKSRIGIFSVTSFSTPSLSRSASLWEETIEKSGSFLSNSSRSGLRRFSLQNESPNLKFSDLLNSFHRIESEKGAPQPQMSTPDALFEYLNWALEMGFWDGRPITLEEAPGFQKELEMRILARLSSLDPASLEFNQMVANLALIGAAPEERPLIQQEIQELGLDGALQAGGVWYSLKKAGRWCDKHKKEILIGVALVATAVAVVVMTGGVATPMLAEAASVAGCAALDATCNPNTEQKPHPKPLSIPAEKYEFQPVPEEEKIPLFNPNQEPPTFLQDGVLLNGHYYTYREFDQQKDYMDFLLRKKRETPAEFFSPERKFPQHPCVIEKGLGTPPVRKSIDTYIPATTTKCPPPFGVIPAIGRRGQATISYSSGINNDPYTITEAAICLHKEFGGKFAIEPHLMHSDSLPGGLSKVGLEKLDEYIEKHPLESAIISFALGGLSPQIPKAILELSDIQKSIDYAAESLTNKAEKIREKDNPNLKQVQVAFSNSGYVMKKALEKVSPEVRETIIMVTVGTTSIINDGSAFKVYNMIGSEDWASKTCNGGEKGIEAAKEKATIIPVAQNETDGILGGHYFTQPEYQAKIKDLVEKEIEGKYEIY